jgi:hypothetical protein
MQKNAVYPILAGLSHKRLTNNSGSMGVARKDSKLGSAAGLRRTPILMAVGTKYCAQPHQQIKNMTVAARWQCRPVRLHTEARWKDTQDVDEENELPSRM